MTKNVLTKETMTALALGKLEEHAVRGGLLAGTDTYEWCVYNYDGESFLALYDSPFVYRVKDGVATPLTVSKAKRGKYCSVVLKFGDNFMRVNLHTILCCMLKQDGFEKLYCKEGYTVNHLSTYNGEYDVYRNLPLRLEVVPDELNRNHMKFVKRHGLSGIDISAYDIDKFEKLFMEKGIELDLDMKRDLVFKVYQLRAKGVAEYSDYRKIYADTCLGVDIR